MGDLEENDGGQWRVLGKEIGPHRGTSDDPEMMKIRGGGLLNDYHGVCAVARMNKGLDVKDEL